MYFSDVPSRRSCGFEDGDDCSWIDRNVNGAQNLWQVWRGAPPSRDAGLTSADSGESATCQTT